MSLHHLLTQMRSNPSASAHRAPLAPTASLFTRLTASLFAGLSISLGAASAAQAALAVGAPAPDFSADAVLGGQPFRFSLAESLKKGPVVVYFYPKAYTNGCTLEAHQFAEATAQFKALGATVIGLSNDTMDTLKTFSVEACRSKFPVAADAGAKIIKAYDAGMMLVPGMADRVSYVISPQGKVLMNYASLDPDGHVKAALAAVQAWRAEQPKP